MTRTIAWWSAGAASAVTAHILLQENPDTIVAYCDTSADEHPDNLRFLTDCERWYGKAIVRLKSAEYADIFDVFDKTGWLVGPLGARCTTELKKNVRKAFQRPDDIHAFGHCADELERVRDFSANNHDLTLRFPLVEHGITHAETLFIVQEVGIELPALYKLGYKNNNCIGCVKGGGGYWNKIRVDFPARFERMAKQERKMGISILRKEVKGVRTPLFLDQLEPGWGRYSADDIGECGLGCGAVLKRATAEISNSGEISDLPEGVPQS